MELGSFVKISLTTTNDYPGESEEKNHIEDFESESEEETNLFYGSSNSVESEDLSKLCSRQLVTAWSDALIPDVKSTKDFRKNIRLPFKTRTNSLILDLIQHGIEISLKILAETPICRLLKTDFTMVDEIHIRQINPDTEQRNFIFYIHAPIAFQMFRELFGITKEDYCKSVCKEPLFQLQTFSKSGCSMYKTYDDRFILKICQKKEAQFLKKLFRDYFLNMAKYPKTLLPKFFGLYGYKEGKRSVRFLIMNNLLPIFVSLQEKYDLKGSTYRQRKANVHKEDKTFSTNEEELLRPLVILKDLDFLEHWSNGFYLKKKVYSLLMASVERDCKLLENYNTMDYSLLLGLHIPKYFAREECKTRRSFINMAKVTTSVAFSKARKIKNLIGPFEARSSKGEVVHIYVGFIDILQSYTLQKKFEHFFKSFIYSSNTISVLRPDLYATRMKNFLKESVFKCIPDLMSIRKKEEELRQNLFNDDA
ncbi:UNVERIFIED_CONTAM: Phosphatidylinositol 4-phosphate 5-kinase type-1 alpha [Trichonephila clavipes]